MAKHLGHAFATHFPKRKAYRIYLTGTGKGWRYHEVVFLETQPGRWVSLDPVLLQVSRVEQLREMSLSEWSGHFDNSRLVFKSITKL